MLAPVAYVALVVLVLFLACYLGLIFRRRGRGIVARRGMSVGADLGTLADKPRVRVRSLTKAGPDRFNLVLTPEPGPTESPGLTTSSDLHLVVLLGEEDFGFELLHEWKHSETPIAIVMPPGSRLVRLRSVNDLQPLTLRRVDEG
jgi:hypothetical protein